LSKKIISNLQIKKSLIIDRLNGLICWEELFPAFKPDETGLTSLGMKKVAVGFYRLCLVKGLR